MSKVYTAIIEKDTETGLYVGYIPTITGAHSQGETLEELRENLIEVLELLDEEGAIQEQSTFVGTQQIDFAA
jgi:predicted RNase H-like HicB family nuclease